MSNNNRPSVHQTHPDIHPDAMKVFLQVMKDRPVEQTNRALELAVAIGIPPNDPSFLFAAACGYLESLLEVGPKEWEQLLLTEVPQRLKILLTKDVTKEWNTLFDTFVGKIQAYEKKLTAHEANLDKNLEKEEAAAVKRQEAAIAQAAGLLLQKARNSLKQELEQERERRFYICLAITLSVVSSIFALGVYTGTSYINTKFQEPRNIFARNLYYWNVDRITKCQKDKNPKCTLWITTPRSSPKK